MVPVCAASGIAPRDSNDTTTTAARILPILGGHDNTRGVIGWLQLAGDDLSNPGALAGPGPAPWAKSKRESVEGNRSDPRTRLCVGDATGPGRCQGYAPDSNLRPTAPLLAPRYFWEIISVRKSLTAPSGKV